MIANLLQPPHGLGEPDMPADFGFEKLLHRNEVGKGAKLIGNFLGVRREHQRRYPFTLSANGFQDLYQPFRIFGLREKEVDRVSRQG